MSAILFDVTTFRALFPAFTNVTTYPTAALQIFWDSATSYITDQTALGCWNGINPKQLTLALNLMAAHLTYLNTLAAAGQPTGLLQAATIDKVSVQLTPPPQVNQWQWWLNQSPYGQQLLALLQAATVGGRFYNPAPVFTAIRR